MRYFYRNDVREKIGPYTVDELHELSRVRTIRETTELVPEDGFEVILWRDLRRDSPDPANAHASSAGASASPPREDSTSEHFTKKAKSDLKVLIPQLLLPFEELKKFPWRKNHRLIFIAAIGLLPLLLISFFTGKGNIQGAYWAVAFYFSALWGVFFYSVFPAPKVRLSTSVACFFVTGFFSISILLLLYAIPPFSILKSFALSEILPIRLCGFILGVGFPEETCKTLALFVVARRLGDLPPQTMLFYGLMSGLGFGIYEGVSYQLGYNRSLSSGAEEYYLLNLLRLTTLPFLHAIWTGMAGYFIGFAYQFGRRRYGLWIVAIGLPTVLHGLYNTFTPSILSLIIALTSVLALYLYLAKSMEFERVLGND